MVNLFKNQQSHADYSASAMEAETIKTRVNPKNQKSRENFLKLLAGAVMICCLAFTEKAMAESWDNVIDESLANHLQLYPNPTQTEIFIKTDLQIEKVEIVDVMGRAAPFNSPEGGKSPVSHLTSHKLIFPIYQQASISSESKPQQAPYRAR